MIEVAAHLIRGAVFLAGEVIECSVTISRPAGNGQGSRYGQILHAWTEFGNLIPGKFGFWREIYHLDGFVSLFLTKSSENFLKNNIFDANLDFYPWEILHFFQPWWKTKLIQVKMKHVII